VIFLFAVSAGLDRSLNITDALDSDTVLIITINIQVLEYADFIDQDAELVRYVGHVIVACLAPDRQLLSDLHSFPRDELHASHNVLFHLDQLRQLLGEVGSEGARSAAAEGVAQISLAEEAASLC